MRPTPSTTPPGWSTTRSWPCSTRWTRGPTQTNGPRSPAHRPARLPGRDCILRHLTAAGPAGDGRRCQPAVVTAWWTAPYGARENREPNVSDDIAGVLLRHQNRIKEISDVLARYGLADHAAAAADTGLRATLVTRIADPDLAALTSGAA